MLVSMNLVSMSTVALTMVAGLFAPSPNSVVSLDGSRVDVRWSDGDSFKIKSGKFAGSKVRLMGYNTLESYGPVHSWGEWTEAELFVLAKGAGKRAGEGEWTCKSSGKMDHYKRLLIRCDDLIEAMVGEGWAHLFELDGEPTPAALAAQQKAIKEKKGIWAKGVPQAVMTSVHSFDEQNWDEAYNRVADPKTGLSRKIAHKKSYGVCEKVCMETSCMLYVPFEQRYGRDRAHCLRFKRAPAAPAPASQPAGGIAPPEKAPAAPAPPALNAPDIKKAE